MPLAEAKAGRDDRLSGTNGRQSPATRDVRGVVQEIGAQRLVEPSDAQLSHFIGLATGPPGALSGGDTVIMMLNAIEKCQPVLRLPGCIDQFLGP